MYQGQKYRFLVIPRYGIDIGKLFVSNGRKLPTKLVNRLAVQMVFNYKINEFTNWIKKIFYNS